MKQYKAMRNYNVLIDRDKIPGFSTYHDAMEFADQYRDEAAEIAIRSDAELAEEAEAAPLAA